MKSLKSVQFFVFFLNFSTIMGQVIDNSSVYKSIESNHYLRLNYENDYFVATDYYYTQGINFEWVSPSLARFFTSRLLIKPEASEVKYGLAAQHNGYTPTNIRSYPILYGDRPFCASLFLKFFSVATDTSKEKRLSSSFSAGVVGKDASGKWMQVTIHRNLHNIEPLGWDNQVHTDVILNYEIEDERKLVETKSLLISSYVNIRGGTLSDKAGAGVTFMTGRFSSPFKTVSLKKKFEFYIYDQPIVSAVGYDATLQGGLFNHTSPYTISANDMQRITFQNNWGFVMTIGKVNLSYYQAFLTKEFRTGLTHRWGGVSIGIDL